MRAFFRRHLGEYAIALPVITGACAAACVTNTAQDFTETFYVTDPVDRIEIVVDRGVFDAVVYDREVATIKRHTFGFWKDLPVPDYSVEDGLLRFEAHCQRGETKCTWDHMLELPLGVSFDLEMRETQISLMDVDGDIAARFDEGFVRGARLSAPNVTVLAGDGEVDLDFAAAPESVTIDVEVGAVTLTLPPGSYRCALAADAGEVDLSGVTCDDAAASVLDVRVGTGDVTVTAL